MKLGTTGQSRGALWRRLLVLFALAAFAQASYIIQTHIHPLAATEKTAGQNGHDQTPQRDDPARCPICQEYLLAGAYVSPAPIAMPLPTLAAFVVFTAVATFTFVQSASHDWHGRAPPLA